MTNIPVKIRDTPIWKDVLNMVEYMYARAEEIVEQHPHEEWRTVNKLRNAASDSLFYVAQAVGNDALEAGEYDWNNARKNIFAMQGMYLFATKEKFITVDPDIVLKLDKLIAEIDKRLQASREADEKKDEQRLKPWLEKYRMWQEMQDQ